MAFSRLTFTAELSGAANAQMESYSWDLEDPNIPEAVLAPASPVVSIHYSPRDSKVRPATDKPSDLDAVACTRLCTHQCETALSERVWTFLCSSWVLACITDNSVYLTQGVDHIQWTLHLASAVTGKDMCLKYMVRNDTDMQLQAICKACKVDFGTDMTVQHQDLYTIGVSASSQRQSAWQECAIGDLLFRMCFQLWSTLQGSCV